ncbi:MAG: DUF4864 domain-containing protein [Rhodospirillaceae bacterium]|jgi:hypothetical protein|nr:DUF4864 domain-containing protein [Rhodospirillaceae bacterium]MBT6203089.1 DUF4864 domain-containing protein [Rhodospirillaceae bacterium]MBT6511761.1 DUF4864 domain-containing protein [Rhodospirillaceae bacterium]MBT7613948.1 DUF4864 domain-containing protein [Rhodospirillaceae bacterium]
MRQVLIALIAMVTITAAQAEDGLSGSDSSAIQAVIQDQLDAFNADDGNRAFSHASPSIQGIFQSPEVFMTMVQQAYLPVYRSAQAEFGELVTLDGQPVQEVYVTGQNGQSSLAVYTMERQEDGSWRIDGCTLLALPDLNA